MSNKITRVKKQYPSTTVTLYMVNVFQLKADMEYLKVVRQGVDVVTCAEANTLTEALDRSIAILQRMIDKYA